MRNISDCWPHPGCSDLRSYEPGVIPLLDPRHPHTIRPELPVYAQKTILQAWVAIIYRLGGIMSPVYAIYKATAHYLAFLIIHLSWTAILASHLESIGIFNPPWLSRAYVKPEKRNRGWVSIPHFTAKFPLTYKIPLSYTLTVETEILINSISIQSRSSNYGSRMIGL